MKRILLFTLSLTLSLTLAGCGDDNPPATNMTGNTFAEATEHSADASTTDSPETSAPGTDKETVSTDDATENTDEVQEIPFSTDFYAYESMAELLAEHNILFGTRVNSSTPDDYTLKSLIGAHFNSITASNEMKAYTLLDQQASQKSEDGMPRMNFDKSTCIIDVASETGTRIRGHVLVWDSNMSDWFFREGYKSNGDYVDAATLKKRLESYISQTITYYEKNYPGLVYCWDVVNEAVGDDISSWDYSDARHIRTKRGGQPNMFYEIIGNDYVELSFLYAKNTVEKLQAENPDVDIKLFYNDYSTFSSRKRDAICALIDSINSYATDENGNYRKLVDGVGMQGYIGGYATQSGCMSNADIDNIEKAIRMFGNHGVEVQITEMAVRNYNDDEATMEKHAQYYAKLMERLVAINAGEEKPLTGISIWGLYDMPSADPSGYHYKQNGPFCGLFTEGYEVKEAFHNVYTMLKNQ